MAYANLRYDVDGPMATVTIDRPERRNALSWDTVRELRAALAEAKADERVRVVVLTGAGEQAFCAGADLGGMQDEAALAVHDARGELADLLRDLWSLGKPTIARVRGFALAGGFGLALACDFVIASDDSAFGTPEVDVGLWPFVITVPLLRSMPPKKALELMLTARRVGAEEAERIGFVTRVVEPEALDDAVHELVSSLAAKSPLTIRLGRDAFYAALDMTTEDALRYLHAMLTVLNTTEDAAEGVTSFAEKRPPQWKGR